MLQSQAGAQPPATEMQLWTEIQAAYSAIDPPIVGPDWFAQTVQRRTGLAERTRLYQVLYPGGLHRDDVMQIELHTKFEIASLTGDFTALRERLQQYAAVKDRPPVAAEVAYWRLVLPVESSQPTGGAATQRAAFVDSGLAYLEAFPGSRHAALIALRVFQEAERSRNIETLRRIVALRRRAAPEHGMTAELEAKLRLIEAIGKQFDWEGLAPAGRAGPATLPASGTTLIYVWSASDPASIAALPSLTRASRQDGVRAFSVIMDEQPAAARDAAVRAGWSSVECLEGMSGPFCRRWGIRRTPTLLVVGADGTLVRVLEASEVIPFLEGMGP